MKKLLILFGTLDVITLIRGFKAIDAEFTSASPYFLAIAIGTTVAYASLIPSAYLLIRQNKIGLWLTYGQFPFRLLFMMLSFGFLLAINPFLLGDVGYKYFLSMLLVLEVVRFVITIKIHRNYFGETTVRSVR